MLRLAPALLLLACADPEPAPPVTAPAGEEVADMTLTSPAFGDGDDLPVRFSCEGDNYSPPLEWTDPPAGTRSFALLIDDQDAPDLDLAVQDAPAGAADAPEPSAQWIAFNLPPDLRSLSEGVLVLEGEGAEGSDEGLNRYDIGAYSGPCPPPGEGHDYLLRLLALDRELDLDPATTTSDSIYAAARGHVLGEAQMRFRYTFAGDEQRD
jgi:Raf kinase inhibitor-like YbhB/YbcL family protein